jgi:uncharacterized protein (TIGR00369 family)
MEPTVPVDPGFELRVRASFGQQAVMGLLDAHLTDIRPGRVELEMPYRADLTQQDGFIHAGILATLGDSAGGYAAFTLFPPDTRVLTTEFKVNLLAPGKGDRFKAVGTVLRHGRTLTVSTFEVFALHGAESTLCVHGTQTTLCLAPRT